MREFINIVKNSQQIFEAPIDHIERIGDWDDIQPIKMGSKYEELPWNQTDQKILGSENSLKKIKDKWSKCSINFNQYFYAGSYEDKNRESGEKTKSELANIIGKQNADKIFKSGLNAINLVHTNNLASQEFISMTPWNIAHRTAHAISGANGQRQTNFNEVIGIICKIFALFDECFYEETNTFENYIMAFYDDSMNKNGVFTRILASVLTMGSARNGRLVGTYEAVYELFAQYMITGKVTLKMFPDIMLDNLENKNPELAAEKLKELEQEFNEVIYKILVGCIGKVYVM